MIYFNHYNSAKIKSLVKDGEQIQFSHSNLVNCFWEICKRYPEEFILWKDEEIKVDLNDNLHDIFKHDLIMASYPVNSFFLPDSIGYVDQFPFVNPEFGVKYPSWRMSTDVGGIKAKTALKFKPLFENIQNFGYLLNSIAKLGQQNSLFCYNEPALVKENHQRTLKSRASVSQIFKFVAQHYKREWIFIFLFCQIKYHNNYPLVSFLKSFFQKSYFNKRIELGSINPNHSRDSTFTTIDVVIPTLGRSKYLHNLLTDLKNQSFLPERVIIVEQDPNPASYSQLAINENDWPFEIVHHFIHKTGACNARNIGMENCSSDYIFLCDDDNHFEKNLIQNAINESLRLEVDCLVTHYPQESEKMKFHRIKQWAAFGSGNAILKRNSKSKDLRFDVNFEFGYGEDHDFGWQLRKNGIDIVYNPNLRIDHLKLDSGGFRQVLQEEERNGPKPSVSMMLLIRKHYNVYMKRGFKVSLFIKFYRKQNIKNPFHYLQSMRKRWNLSENMCDDLLN